MTTDALRRRLKAVGLSPRGARDICEAMGWNVRQLLESREDLSWQGDIPYLASGRWPSHHSEAGISSWRDDQRIVIILHGQTRRATVDPFGQLVYEDHAAPDLKKKRRHSGDPSTTTSATKTAKVKVQGPKAPRRAYLSQAARDWLAELRREGECGLWTITQNIVERIVKLPRVELAGYLYMRGLALNDERPGCFWISHDTLAKKLTVSRATAERLTQGLRRRGLIRLAKRGGSYGGANYYVIRPLTQILLDGLTAPHHQASPSPVRGSTPSPVRDHRLSKERVAPSRAPLEVLRARRLRGRSPGLGRRGGVPCCDSSEAASPDDGSAEAGR